MPMDVVSGVCLTSLPRTLGLCGPPSSSAISSSLSGVGRSIMSAGRPISQRVTFRLFSRGMPAISSPIMSATSQPKAQAP